MAKFYEELISTLKTDGNFVSDEGTLLKNKIYEYAMRMDEDLISLLFNNSEIRKQLFRKVQDNYVFDKVEFGWIINNKEFLPDNYTKYKNQIGLAFNESDYLLNCTDVVLNFPYKDCLLEFDSTDEDENRYERFYNEVLSQNDIDKLLAPKIFTNSKCYNAHGVTDCYSYNKNDNLIIKGNNLLVMHSLLPKFEGMIKCMYWDILYNTTNDVVPYNDSFKHSSWLVMMKNRLEVARKLLKDDGVIFIQCDYNEQAYLKVLMDEIFKDGYISLVTVKTSSESGVKVNSNKPIKTSEYILIYAKDKTKYQYNQIRIKTGYDKNYNYYVDNPESDYNDWKITNIKDKYSEIFNKPKNEISESELNSFQIKYCNNIFSVRDISNNLKKYLSDNNINREKVFEYITSTGKKTLLYKNGEVVFVKNKVFEIDGKPELTKIASDIWTDIAWDGIANEGEISLKNGKKPEKLIERILLTSTVEGDLVLDAYLGSGTTCAVSHKMKRQYIGIEQLESHVDKALSRMKAVINGEQTGISKNVNWNGGGEFKYFELKNNNNKYLDKILKISNSTDLLLIWEDMKNNAFISNKINIKIFDNKKDEFNNLTFDEQKRFLISLLDKNMLYANYFDIDDEEYKISQDEKNLNREFYEDITNE